jgi:sec-independent protein translocase protein TatB
MFDIGWSELLVIGVVALIVIGPKELPATLRTLGQWMGKVRRMAGDFQDQFREAMREAEIADLKKEVDEMTEKAVQDYARFDPLGDVRKDIEKATELPSLDTLGSSPSSSAPETPAPETPVPEAAPSAGIEPAAASTEAAPAAPTSHADSASETKPDAGRAPA